MTRDEFIEGNLPLVHKLANRFRGRGVEYEELYAAGCVGLVKAVDRFEPERGLCFSTYAVPVILGEIRRLFRDGGSVKISRSLKELSVKAARVRDQLSANGEPRISDIAQLWGSLPRKPPRRSAPESLRCRWITAARTASLCRCRPPPGRTRSSTAWLCGSVCRSFPARTGRYSC